MFRIKELRLEKGLSMRQTSIELGIPYTTYISYEKEDREPNSETLIMLADYFNCSIDYLIGRSDNKIDDSVLDKVNVIDNDLLEKYGNIYQARIGQDKRNLLNILNIEPLPKMKKVPLLGTIVCGEPILAEENIEDYINMPEDAKGTFALRCKGDSMINARIFDGDIVYIREQPDVENGEIAAVLIDNEATLKRVYKYENRIELRPENPTFKVLNYENEELNSIRILGKAVGFYSKVI